jgi:PAS domain S-box-containing protein
VTDDTIDNSSDFKLKLQATALETAANAVMITNRHGAIIWVNRAFTTLTGYTAEEVLSENPRFLKSGHQNEDFYKRFWNTILSGKSWHGEFTNRRKGGTLYHDEHTITPVRVNGGEITHFVAIMADITARKEAEAQVHKLNAMLESMVCDRTNALQKANAELESFVHSVAHDLRTPLRGISGIIQALVEDFPNLDPGVSDHLERVRDCAERMQKMTDGLLTLARTSHIQMEAYRIDLTAMSRSIIASFRLLEPARQVEVVIAEKLSITGDPVLLRTVMENLLGNAWKFTSKKPDGRIEVGMDLTGPEPAFFVRDNGAGFDMEFAKKLFGPFQRLHSANEFSGTGIGLATVYRIISRHGGRIRPDAKPDEGATFYFTLPMPPSGPALAL